MAAFHREVAKYFAKYAASAAGAPCSSSSSSSSSMASLVAFTPAAPQPSAVRSFLSELLAPVWFRFFRGPLDRWNQAAIGKYLREQGLMYDDLYSDKEPVIERALELLPEDLATARYRRIMRATHLNHVRLYLPPNEQNYDPFIPYLAPYVEEAKFQLQEEEELLGYHMWERRLYSGGCTGLGDFEPGMHFLVSFPNMYGGGGGGPQQGSLVFFSPQQSPLLRTSPKTIKTPNSKLACMRRLAPLLRLVCAAYVYIYYVYNMYVL
uniref:Ubiquinol-cytochrome c reductase complex 14 kDa protein n=1 Tax=Eimeria tenella TaxID=5802 RepID=H9BA03_EIMTE|nr:hypothetical protein [Eimeria tenella]